jgi:hypothetical protein
MSIWKGCGHKTEPVFFKNDPLGVIAVVEYSEDNPKDLCYDCWAKERGLPYSKERLERREAEKPEGAQKCPKCGGEGAHLLGSFDGRPPIIQCDDCGYEGEVEWSTQR